MEQSTTRYTGTVKWFDEKKGYGFISRTDGEKDVFVHYSDIPGEGFKTLREGDTVEFGIKDSDRGPKATDVRATA